jgi:hypothetical protein
VRPQHEPGTVGVGAVNGQHNHRVHVGRMDAADPNRYARGQSSQDRLQPVPAALETAGSGARFRGSWPVLSLKRLLRS